MNKNKQYPWETHPHIWKTKPSFMAWLRGSLRKSVWDMYPVKLQYKNDNVKPPPLDYKGKAKSGAYCAISGEWLNKSKLQVDHIKGNISLKEWDDIMPFLEHLLLCHDNLQLVTPTAHKIKSYAEQNGLTYEEAEIEKVYIIPFKKLCAVDQKHILRGEHNKDLTTQDKRVMVYRQSIKEK